MKLAQGSRLEHSFTVPDGRKIQEAIESGSLGDIEMLLATSLTFEISFRVRFD